MSCMVQVGTSVVRVCVRAFSSGGGVSACNGKTLGRKFAFVSAVRTSVGRINSVLHTTNQLLTVAPIRHSVPRLEEGWWCQAGIPKMKGATYSNPTMLARTGGSCGACCTK